jgi:hypothetical protein
MSRITVMGGTMETLLVVAIVITALAIVVQAGILVAMYLMAKRVTSNVDGLVSESKRMLGPLEQITGNAKTASDDMVVVGKIARDQMHHVGIMVDDAHRALTQMTSDVSQQVSETVDEVRDRVSAPFRQWTAITRGISTGIRVLLRRQEPSPSTDIRDTPAA